MKGKKVVEHRELFCIAPSEANQIRRDQWPNNGMKQRKKQEITKQIKDVLITAVLQHQKSIRSKKTTEHYNRMNHPIGKSSKFLCSQGLSKQKQWLDEMWKVWQRQSVFGRSGALLLYDGHHWSCTFDRCSSASVGRVQFPRAPDRAKANMYLYYFLLSYHSHWIGEWPNSTKKNNH